MRSLILILCFIFSAHMLGQKEDFKTISFDLADANATELQGEALYNLPGLVQGLTKNLKTDIEKFRAIYYWVSHNIRGEYHLMLENNKMRKKFSEDSTALAEWNIRFRKQVFKKLLIDKETLCTGYAYLIQEMAGLVGLECEIIDGYDLTNILIIDEVKVPNHSWNAVKINNKWYLCDATWSSGITDLTNFLFEFDYDDSFFLMHPIEFAKTHEPIAKQWLLVPQDSIKVDQEVKGAH